MSKETNAITKSDIVDVVAGRVRGFMERGEMHLPDNYSPENALKSAYLKLQETKDKSGKPVLSVCTSASIANSLFDMVIQGLNPAKNQCYFIAYGQQLVCQRSYFGSMAVVKNVAGAKDVWGEVVYKGDVFEYEIRGKVKKIIKHGQKLENVDGKNIVAAYAVIEFDDRPDHTEIMTIADIKQAWAQGQTYKEGGSSVHHKFAAEMAKKTVINRACKAFINSSSDSSILVGAYNRADDARAEDEIDTEIEEQANMRIIDIEYAEAEEVVTDGEPETEKNEKPAKTEQKPPEKAQKDQKADPGQQTIGGPGF